MNRRTFVMLSGTAGASGLLAPRIAHAQQVPVVGFLVGGTAPVRSPAFIQALRENGFDEGRTVEFDFRWGPWEQMPRLAAELVRRRVAVIRAGGPPAVRAAMDATKTIPIVFGVGEDPVKEGLVTSLARPGGNVTGFSGLFNVLVGKRLELLREMAPQAMAIAFVASQTNPNIGPDTADVQAAADAMGLRLHVLTAANEPEMEAAFEKHRQLGLDATLVGVDPWYRENPKLIADLAARHRVIASYERRSFALAGGLSSYGPDPSESDRQIGIYVARILKGAKPADLPVQQATKFEFVLNLKAAKALGVEVPTPVLLRATEVIE
jgi:putative ABC transport system substrate-binding protein